MQRNPQTELLQNLRATLDHFDHSPDFGDGADVAIIRQYLNLRIREAEGRVRVPSWVQAA